MKTENAILAEVINYCFDLSMDGRIKREERKEFLALGKRLRGCLLNLLSAQFNDGTQAVIDANKSIKEINEEITSVSQELTDTARVIQEIGQLVSVLDDLLKIAVSFI